MVFRITRFTLAVLIALAAAPAAFADSGAAGSVMAVCSAETSRANPWAVTFATMPAAPAPRSLTLSYTDDQTAAPRRPVPFEYSEGYKTRAKIHKIASFATLPLFIADYVIGQDLYNHPGDESKKGLHGGLAATTGVLFGINSVTGVWNLLEARKDPSHKTKRTIHGILMLAADAGFVATGALAPDSEGSYDNYTSQRSTHRTVALTSMGIATVGYLMMLFGR
ncbi:MAG: hypothetical protein NTY02_14130 [Acidobacteria bacterium]|nr:hypothetical protein [Acidobacteriota bacterium]